MNEHFEPNGPFERGRTNQAILMVVAMAFGGIALDDGIHSLTPPSGDSTPRMKRLIPEADQRARTDAIAKWTQRRNDHPAKVAGPRIDPCDEIR